MPKACSQLIGAFPEDSGELLWEWLPDTDAFSLSRGAREALNIEESPAFMTDYYKFIPAETVSYLQTLRENIRAGQPGARLECGYICNGVWTSERMLILHRDGNGLATRVLGQLKVSPLVGANAFPQARPAFFPETGLWVWNVPGESIWHDRSCQEILGSTKAQSGTLSPDEALRLIHPAERKSLRRHYQLLCAGRLIGDVITDVVRIRWGDDAYAPALLHAAVMKRNTKGEALEVIGLVFRQEQMPGAKRVLNPRGRLAKALKNMAAAQWNWDLASDAIYLSPCYLSILGLEPDSGLTRIEQWRRLIHPDDAEEITRAQQEIIESPANGDAYECAYRIQRSDGGWVWIFDRGYVAWRDATGHAGRLIGIVTNITTVQAERDRLEELVRHDTLTGLRSRAFCDLELKRIESNSIRPVCVISIDINGLKMINDCLGHAAGDRLLTNAARIISSSLRASDVICRIGGDEFLVLLPNCSLEKGQKLLRKVEAGFREHAKGNQDMPTLAACGLGCASDASEPLSLALARADEAMYAAKKESRKADHAKIRKWIEEETGSAPAADERLI